MDPQIWAALITAVVAAAVALVGSFLSWRSGKRALDNRLKELREQQAGELLKALHEGRFDYEQELLTRRLDAHQELFGLLQPLALDGRPQPGEEEARALGKAITDWYYQTGGLLLSEPAFKAMLKLRNALLDRSGMSDEPLKLEYPPRALASKLRTQLTTDVSSRRKPFDTGEDAVKKNGGGLGGHSQDSD